MWRQGRSGCQWHHVIGPSPLKSCCVLQGKVVQKFFNGKLAIYSDINLQLELFNLQQYSKITHYVFVQCSNHTSAMKSKQFRISYYKNLCQVPVFAQEKHLNGPWHFYASLKSASTMFFNKQNFI